MHLVVIGGSDAGISTALRARELDPSAEVTVVVADAYPNFSICGIPMLIGQEVGHWTDLAHRTRADLEDTGMRLELDTLATRVDAAAQELWVRPADGVERAIGYDELVVGTGAVPLRPPRKGSTGPGRSARRAACTCCSGSSTWWSGGRACGSTRRSPRVAAGAR